MFIQIPPGFRILNIFRMYDSTTGAVSRKKHVTTQSHSSTRRECVFDFVWGGWLWGRVGTRTRSVVHVKEVAGHHGEVMLTRCS